MVGMVVLVMAGVGLSLVVDKRLKYSSGSVKLEKEMILEASELEGLMARHEEGTRCLEEAEDRRRSGATLDGLSSEEKGALKERKSVLEIMQERLRESINQLDNDFTQYRTDYCRQVRQAAIGESMGDITLRNGREYKQVKIKQVTDVGLEIRHADGIARIQAPDLDQKIRDRFQWNDELRRQVLENELKNLKGEAEE